MENGKWSGRGSEEAPCFGHGAVPPKRSGIPIFSRPPTPSVAPSPAVGIRPPMTYTDRYRLGLTNRKQESAGPQNKDPVPKVPKLSSEGPAGPSKPASSGYAAKYSKNLQKTGPKPSNVLAPAQDTSNRVCSVASKGPVSKLVNAKGQAYKAGASKVSPHVSTKAYVSRIPKLGPSGPVKTADPEPSNSKVITLKIEAEASKMPSASKNPTLETVRELPSVSNVTAIKLEAEASKIRSASRIPTFQTVAGPPSTPFVSKNTAIKVWAEASTTPSASKILTLQTVTVPSVSEVTTFKLVTKAEASNTPSASKIPTRQTVTEPSRTEAVSKIAAIKVWAGASTTSSASRIPTFKPELLASNKPRVPKVNTEAPQSSSASRIPTLQTVTAPSNRPSVPKVTAIKVLAEESNTPSASRIPTPQTLTAPSNASSMPKVTAVKVLAEASKLPSASKVPTHQTVTAPSSTLSVSKIAAIKLWAETVKTTSASRIPISTCRVQEPFPTASVSRIAISQAGKPVPPPDPILGSPIIAFVPQPTKIPAKDDPSVYQIFQNIKKRKPVRKAAREPVLKAAREPESAETILPPIESVLTSSPEIKEEPETVPVKSFPDFPPAQLTVATDLIPEEVSTTSVWSLHSIDSMLAGAFAESLTAEADLNPEGSIEALAEAFAKAVEAADEMDFLDAVDTPSVMEAFLGLPSASESTGSTDLELHWPLEINVSFPDLELVDRLESELLREASSFHEGLGLVRRSCSATIQVLHPPSEVKYSTDQFGATESQIQISDQIAEELWFDPEPEQPTTSEPDDLDNSILNFGPVLMEPLWSDLSSKTAIPFPADPEVDINGNFLTEPANSTEDPFLGSSIMELGTSDPPSLNIINAYWAMVIAGLQGEPISKRKSRTHDSPKVRKRQGIPRSRISGKIPDTFVPLVTQVWAEEPGCSKKELQMQFRARFAPTFELYEVPEDPEVIYIQDLESAPKKRFLTQRAYPTSTPYFRVHYKAPVSVPPVILMKRNWFWNGYYGLVTLTNQSIYTVTFRLRASTPHRYRVTPSLGTIPAGKTQEIRVETDVEQVLTMKDLSYDQLLIDTIPITESFRNMTSLYMFWENVRFSEHRVLIHGLIPYHSYGTYMDYIRFPRSGSLRLFLLILFLIYVGLAVAWSYDLVRIPKGSYFELLQKHKDYQRRPAK